METNDQACQYFLDEPPANTVSCRPGPAVSPPIELPAEPKWSNTLPMPKLGDRVSVRDMGKGPGRVIGFFVEHGWVGMHVELDTPKVIGTKSWKIVMVFGVDL